MLWKAILPTLRRRNLPFRLAIKGEDEWGNLSDKGDRSFGLRATLPVAGLPDKARFAPGAWSVVIEDLSVDATGDLIIELVDTKTASFQ